MKQRALRALLWSLVLAGLGVLGFVLLATCFVGYDDEGYVLWSVRSFCEGRPLYTEVYSQYGPLFYVAYRVLHAVTGLTFDNESGRLLTLAYWMGTALGAGLMVQALTRRLTAGLAATVLAFAFLANNTREPFHPGSVLALLSAMAAGLGAWLLLTGRHRHFAWSMALIATAMALIKINVGLFLGAALGGWMLINSHWPARLPHLRRSSALAVAGVSCVAVLQLISTQLNVGWAINVMVIFIAAMLGMTARLFFARSDLHELRDWKLAVLATLGLSAAVTLACWAWGTAPGHLLEAVVLAPMRHPGVFSFPPNLPAGAVTGALGMLVIMILASRAKLSSRSLDLVAFAQLGAVLWLLAYTCVTLPNNIWVRTGYSFGPSLAALFIFPVNGDQNAPRFHARLWIAWVFIWQTLHAYPVAGTQLAWGSFLLVPISILAWFDAWERLRSRFSKLKFVVFAAPVVAALLATAQLVELGRLSWLYGARLDLPGARWLRPPIGVTQILQSLQPNLIRHADTVFSYPGLFSFNIWTGKPTPTDANATHWFSLLSRDQQIEIKEKLRSDPRACVIMHRYVLGYLYNYGFIPENPLTDYVIGGFAPAIRLGDYDLWVKRGRRIEAINTFRLAAGYARGWLPPPARPVTRVTLSAPGQAEVPLTWTLTPAPAASETDPEPLARLEAFLPAPYQGAAQLLLYDEKGELITRLLQNEAPNEAALILPGPPPKP